MFFSQTAQKSMDRKYSIFSRRKTGNWVALLHTNNFYFVCQSRMSWGGAKLKLPDYNWNLFLLSLLEGKRGAGGLHTCCNATPTAPPPPPPPYSIPLVFATEWKINGEEKGENIYNSICNANCQIVITVVLAEKGREGRGEFIGHSPSFLFAVSFTGVSCCCYRCARVTRLISHIHYSFIFNSR